MKRCLRHFEIVSQATLGLVTSAGFFLRISVVGAVKAQRMTSSNSPYEKVEIRMEYVAVEGMDDYRNLGGRGRRAGKGAGRTCRSLLFFKSARPFVKSGLPFG